MLQTSPGATAAEGATTAALWAGGSSAGSVIPKPFGETVRVRIRRLPEDTAANPPSPFGPEKSAARADAAAAALVVAPKSWVTAPILPRSVSVTTHSSPELAPGSASASTAIPGSEALTRPVVPVVDGPAMNAPSRRLMSTTAPAAPAMKPGITFAACAICVATLSAVGLAPTVTMMVPYRVGLADVPSVILMTSPVLGVDTEYWRVPAFFASVTSNG